MSKTKKKTLAQNSLEIRNLKRHPMPPPCFYFKDRKAAGRKNACRKQAAKV